MIKDWEMYIYIPVVIILMLVGSKILMDILR